MNRTDEYEGHVQVIIIHGEVYVTMAGVGMME